MNGVWGPKWVPKVDFGAPPLGPAMNGVWGPKRAPKVDFGAPLGASYKSGLGSKLCSKSRFWSPILGLVVLDVWESALKKFCVLGPN